MGKDMSLFNRVKVAIWFVRKRHGLGFGLVETCGVCAGLKLVITGKKESGMKYKAKYRCLECGATAKARERWKRG